MSTEDIIQSVWRRCNVSKFVGQTYSHGPGFKIEFKENGVMDVLGGNLDLPNFISLELGTFPKLVFHESEYINEKKLYRDDPEGILEKINLVREHGREIEADWQILKLLDPRVLLKNGNHEFYGMEKQGKDNVITIGYDIEKLKQNGSVKISDSFSRFLTDKKLAKRVADLIVDEHHNLHLIRQHEILSSENVSIKFQYLDDTIMEEMIIHV